jgi:type III secretory pathway component EscT
MSELLSSLAALVAPGASLGEVVLVACLVAARLAPIAWMSPVIAPVGAPGIVRSATLAGLTAALLPLALTHGAGPSGAASVVLALLRELTIGLALLAAASVPVVAYEHAGRALDAWRGSEPRDGTYGRLAAALGGAAFVAIGGLRLVVRALGSGLLEVPVGGALAARDAQAMALSAAEVGLSAIGFAVVLAAPALVALVAAELGLALAARAARFGRALDGALGLRGGLVLGAALLFVAAATPELATLTRWAIDRAAEIGR